MQQIALYLGVWITHTPIFSLLYFSKQTIFLDRQKERNIDAFN